MNRRSFLWQSVCSSLLLARTTLSQQGAAIPVSKPSDASLTEFARGLAGTVFRPDDPTYEHLRKGYAAKFDAHPLLIVYPLRLRDIQASLSFVKNNHLPLSGFRNIAIATDKSSARIGGGMLSGAVEIETAKAGVATVLGQCPSVGVGGFFLGGGVGPLMGKYGLGCDNVISAELVLADGRAVKASAHENPDLYWAIRGGGGNFGIVTQFEVALHPVSKVFAGNITLEAADPRDFLRAFSQFISTVPDELTLIALMSGGAGGKPQLEIEACFVGEEGRGEKVLAPLRRFPGVVHDTVQLRPYLELEQMVPAEIPPSHEEHCSGFFTELDDRRIEILRSAFLNAPVPVDCFLVHLHGAVTRVPAAATPFPLRRNGITFDVAAYWKPPAGQRAAREWVETLRAKLPVDKDGTYVNVMEREGEDGVRRAYGANYAQLQLLKAHYDPQNLFALNQNIRPA
jgi:hypothetical protein